MKFSTVSRGVTTKLNIPDNPRNAWTEERDRIYNEKEMQNLLQVNTISLEDSFFDFFRGQIDKPFLFRSKQ